MSEIIDVPYRKIPFVGPDPLTEEWFEKRFEIIGSSEAAAACGLSKYRQPLAVYQEKIGEIPPFAGNEHTRRGRRYEPLIAEDWEELNEKKLRRYPCPMFIHPDHSFIAATPDGEIDDDEGLEIKSSTFRMLDQLGDEGTDFIPQDWVIQAQQQMAVMGWLRVRFAIKIGDDLLQYCVQRNENLIRLMISAEQELIERIHDRRPPEPDWKHASTLELVKELHSSIADTRIMLTEEEAGYWAKYEFAGKLIKKLEARRKELKARVLHAIGDHGAGLLGDGRMVRRKLITTEPYVVTKEPFIDARAVKADTGRIVERTVVLNVTAAATLITHEPALLCLEGTDRGSHEDQRISDNSDHPATGERCSDPSQTSGELPSEVA